MQIRFWPNVGFVALIACVFLLIPAPLSASCGACTQDNRHL